MRFFFLFCCYGDHLNLLSFPTRRSSDLEDDQQDQHHVDQRDHVDLGERRRGAASARGAATRRVQFLRENLDRKSTRLNSSHLVISYAVFCVKKKNVQKQKRNNWCIESV